MINEKVRLPPPENQKLETGRTSTPPVITEGARGVSENGSQLRKDAVGTSLGSRAQYYCARREEFKLNNLSLRIQRFRPQLIGHS
jgi:hypothetical protein